MHVSLLYSQCHTLEVLIMPVLVDLSIHLRIHPSNLSNIHFVHCVYFISIQGQTYLEETYQTVLAEL